MRIGKYIISGLLIASFGLSGCAAKPIKIGLVGNLMGRNSELSVAIRDGVILAVEEINSLGGIWGRPIQLIVKDDKQDPQTALQIEQEFSHAKVTAVIGHMSNAITATVLNWINRQKMPLINPLPGTAINQENKEYFISCASAAEQSITSEASYAVNQLKLKKIAIVYDLSHSVDGLNWYHGFKNEFIRLGGSSVISATFYSSNNINFTGIAHEVLSSKPDGLLIVANGIDAAIFCQQIRKFEPTLPILATPWVMGRLFLEYGGQAVAGTVLSYAELKTADSLPISLVKQKFTQRFGEPATVYSLRGYQTARRLFSAIARCRHVTSGNIIRNLKNAQQKPVVSSLFRVTDGQFTRFRADETNN